MINVARAHTGALPHLLRHDFDQDPLSASPPLWLVAGMLALPRALLACLALSCLLACAPRDQRASAGDAPCAERRFEDAVFWVCAFDAHTQELRLASQRQDGGYLRGFEALAAALGPEQDRVRFAMNAGMFNDSGAPIGLYVERGQERHPPRLTEGPGNFHMQPNGVFSQDSDGVVRVETSDAFAARAGAPQWATQSGPMLVIDGALHPAFNPNGQSRLLRNGVGVRGAHGAFFVISAGPVSFGRFARFFRDELKCANALFLDGAVSSLWAPALRRLDHHAPLGPMLVVIDD